MIDRRDFIKKSLVSPLVLLSAQYPSALVAQNHDEYRSILYEGMVPGDSSYYFNLLNISRNFIYYRAARNGPFGYESRPAWWVVTHAAWQSTFLRGEEVHQMRRDFARSENGQDLANTLEQIYINNQDSFYEWYNPGDFSQVEINNILSAQALFAIDFAMHNETSPDIGSSTFLYNGESNREVGWRDIVEIFENFTWIWPFC